MVDKNVETDIQAELAALKVGFAGKIPAKVDEIRQGWKKLKSTPEDPDTFHLLRRQAHTLAGTSATYGFEETGRLARAIEITLQDDLTEDYTTWVATAVDEVETLLVQLESVAESESVE
jgi:chemotaxis protein histidine kinase CheA